MAPPLNHPAGVTFIDEHHGPVHTDASTYYGGEERFSRGRTYSQVCTRFPCVTSRPSSWTLTHFCVFIAQSFAHGYNPKRPPTFEDANHQRARRMSHDEKGSTPRRFLIDVEETIRVVLEQEDTDGDFQISVTDAGPKMMALGTATSNGFKSFDIRVSFGRLCSRFCAWYHHYPCHPSLALWRPRRYAWEVHLRGLPVSLRWAT